MNAFSALTLLVCKKLSDGVLAWLSGVCVCTRMNA